MSRLMIVEVPSYSCEFKGIREVRELVHCRDCRYWHKNRKDGDDIPIHDACYDFTDDDFCSYGERKESE